MEVEKFVFDEKKFEEDLGEFCWERDIYNDISIIKDFVDEDLKAKGLDSGLRFLVEPLSTCSSFKDYYEIADGKNDIYELDNIEVYNEFIDSWYSAEMADPEFAKATYLYVYDKMFETFTTMAHAQSDFLRFEDLRKDKNGNCKDAVDLDALHKELGMETEKERER